MTSAMQTVLEVAEWCDRRGHPLPVQVLAGILNAAGHRTSYGTPYRGRRGTYRLVKATYRRLIQAGRSAEAAMVARTFTRPNGAYAY